MFRRQENTIEPDPWFQADLKELKFFINDVGQIRMIGAPDREYIYHATTIDRVNVMRREAMQECSRQETEKRLSALRLGLIYLPHFTTTKPTGPHVSILAPAPEILKTRKRIIVLVNDSIQDLGILAYRQMQRELGLNGGSVVDFVKNIIKRSTTGVDAEKYNDIFKDGFKLEDDNDVPALVVMDTGQLLYSHKYNKAMTMRSWGALPRKSIAHDEIKIHDVENRVPGHRDAKEHVKSVFDDVLCNPDRLAAEAEVYIIAIENGVEAVLGLVEDDFKKYGSRITAMALIHSPIVDTQIKNPNLRAFLRQRTREWKYSNLSTNPHDCTELPAGFDDDAKDDSPQDATSNAKVNEHIAWNEIIPKGSALSGLTNTFHRLVLGVAPAEKDKPAEPTSPTSESSATNWTRGEAASCPRFAGGLEDIGECILTHPPVQDAILSFFEEVAQDPEHYRNRNIKVHTLAPHPTIDNPLVLDPDNHEVAEFQSLPPEMTPEQAEVDFAKEKLKHMKLALQACTATTPALEEGRTTLVKRIEKQEAKIEKLEKKALATGGLTAGQAPDMRENWQPQKEGPMVKFAGTMVDSEMLKIAGLTDTVEELLGDVEDYE